MRIPRLVVLTTLLLALVPAVASAALPYGFTPGRSLPFSGSRWVAQGLTYWPKQDALIASYYDCNCDANGASLGGMPQNSQVVVMKRGSNRILSRLILPYGGHVGGVAMTKNYLWVANSGSGDGYQIHTYKTSKLLERPSPVLGTSIRYKRRFKASAASYLTITGNQLWVGDFDSNIAYRYTIGKLGKTIAPNHGANGTVTTPDNTQGMAVRGSKAVYSASSGRNDPSAIITRPLAAKSGGTAMTAPNMSEGITFAKDGLHVLFESSSYEYHDSSLKTTTIDVANPSVVGF